MNKINFRTIFGLALLAFLTWIAPVNAATKSVTLAWDPAADSQVAGYRVYYGTRQGTYSSSINTSAQASTATVNNLPTGGTYYFVVTAYYANGVESTPSQEIVHSLTTDPSFQLDALPLSQVTTPGSAVTLSVTASGPEALSYQWHKDGIEIAGATGSTYTIEKIGSAQTGAYSVTVRDSGASLSTPAAVVSTVLMELPQQIAIEGAPGATYSVTYKNDLGSTNWSQLTNLSLTSNRMEWSDSSASNAAQRFYRVTPAAQ